jgi:hypothetical protein
MPSLPPIKNTAGEGFAVEDAVVAWLSCHLVTGVPWYAGTGIIRAIECQMRQDGWSFDDIVLRSEKDGVECRCACSVKSQAVFGKNGAPLKFARALWHQWLDESASGFQRGRDSLVLISAQHEPEVREAWFGLTETARSISPESLTTRCESAAEPSPLRRAAFRSLRIDDELGQAVVDPVETARLLQKFHLVEQDFQHSESQSVTLAISLCQQALSDVQRERASELWEALLNFAASVRRKGGCITLPDLLTKLSHRFALKQHPNYAADWATILSDSLQRLESLPAKIGGLVSVERCDLLELVSREAERHRSVAILGESGNGKSVIALQWATADAAGVVWLRAADLSTVGGLRMLFRLSHSLAELFANSCQPFRLVLDGLDKSFDESAFDEAALVLRSASAAVNSDRCQIVLTCCPEDWERVRGHLIRRGISIPAEVVRVGRFTDSELREACQRLSSLRLLAQRPHLRPILRWPKALDIVATFWRVSDAPLSWATESDFARWFWWSAICREHPASFRDRVARKLAVQLADRMAANAQLNDFARDEAETIAEMAREGHIEIDTVRGTVRFAHELIADWARQRELQVQGEAVGTFLQKRLQSPLWHRAVRFHGLDLLDHQSDATTWQRLFLEFNSGSAVDEIAQNLLLEAPVFALEQCVVLEHLWPVFQADEGRLLRRFLRQFLRVATIPNEKIVAHFRSRSPDLQIDAISIYRRPWVPYWLGVLEFLGAHAEETTAAAREEVADVCLLWLPLQSAISTRMKDAAKLAVVAARQFYRSGKRWRDVSAEEKICQALLAAAPEMPDEVAELALTLSGRDPPDAEDSFAVEEHENRSQFIADLGPFVPWPEGPRRSCEQFFSKAFMNGGHAAPFFHTLPEVAVEVMFAVLLDIPRAICHPRDIHHELDEHGFNAGALESCFWTSGPFLAFLRINPTVALPAIIRLVNFATDRAYELGEDLRQHIEVPVTVDGKRRVWRGHQFSYLWHQGHVFGPRAVGCALLSLEKWFYTLMDDGQPLDEHIVTILRESRSIAFAAVLISVGKRKPELFLGPLQPMLEAVDFYWIEISLRHEDGFHASAFFDRSGAIFDAWREWVQMPHRKESIGELALRMFLGHTKWREMIGGFRRTWQTRLDSATLENPAPRWLPNIVSQFDLSNWHADRSEDGALISYKPPSDLPQPTPEEAERFKRSELLTLLPFQCSQALLEATEFSEDQMSNWWSQLSEVRAFPVPSSEFEIWQSEDALCGIVAVAVVRHRAWLAADPAREAEALAILREVGTQPPKRFWLVEDDICAFKWDNFAAWALTTLWCEQPNDPYFLQAVGALALWDRYLVVAQVMSVAAQHRTQLGTHFDRLLAHTLRYSPARHRARMEQHMPHKSFDRDAWARVHLEKFLAGKTKPLPASWVGLVEPRKRRGREANDLTRGFDIGHMCAALDWAEDLGTARDEEEQLTWLRFHRESLLCAVTRIEWMPDAPSRERWNDRQDRFPYKDERRLLERIARIVARLAPGGNHRPLWEPIFALGRAGAPWVEAFVSQWLIEATDDDGPGLAFIEQWLAMLSYAESSPAWKSGGDSRSSSREMWIKLLGFSPFSSVFWNEKLAPAIEATRAFHERWARSHVHNHRDASTYIYFLKTPAARALRVDGLCLLYETVPVDDEYFWRDASTRDVFASLLRLLLDEHWHQIIANPLARNGLMSFLLKLAALQHPLGSEVLAMAGSRFGGMTDPLPHN